MLNGHQKNLVRQSWAHQTKSGPTSIGAKIFRRIFEKHPLLRAYFSFGHVADAQLEYDKNFKKHALLFVGALDSVVQNLDDLDKIIPALNKYGALHVRLINIGFKPDHWDFITEIMIECAAEWAKPVGSRNVTTAWSLLVAFIVEEMRKGFDAERRRLKRENLNCSNQEKGDEHQDEVCD